MPRFLIFLALVASSVASLGQTTPLAPVTNLTTGEVYLTIQEAVDEAANGEELQLASARFEEHVALMRQLCCREIPMGSPSLTFHWRMDGA